MVDKFFPNGAVLQDKHAGHLGGVTEFLGHFEVVAHLVLQFEAPDPSLQAVQLSERPPLKAESPIIPLSRIADMCDPLQVEAGEILLRRFVVRHMYEHDLDAAILDRSPAMSDIVQGLFAKNTTKMPQKDQHHRAFFCKCQEVFPCAGHHLLHDVGFDVEMD